MFPFTLFEIIFKNQMSGVQVICTTLHTWLVSILEVSLDMLKTDVLSRLLLQFSENIDIGDPGTVDSLPGQSGGFALSGRSWSLVWGG